MFEEDNSILFPKEEYSLLSKTIKRSRIYGFKYERYYTASKMLLF